VVELGLGAGVCDGAFGSRCISNGKFLELVGLG
jgi:hypothetical protein